MYTMEFSSIFEVHFLGIFEQSLTEFDILVRVSFLPFGAYLIEVDCLIVVCKVEADLSVVGLESVEV